jgi:hypothetical protein
MGQRSHWHERISRHMRELIDSQIAGRETWLEIYGDLRLRRFCAPSTFRRYLAQRRREFRAQWLSRLQRRKAAE